MGALTGFLVRAYMAVFGGLERVTNGWFLGLAARLLFAGVLLMYFWNSALTKISDGMLGFLSPSAGAYAQILPQMMEQVSYDTSQIAFFPFGLIVLLGTWGEFVLPLLVVLGLFTRAASLGMIVFIVVMTYVDVTGHGADIGTLFNKDAFNTILAERLLWVFLLLVPVLKGPGLISLDAVLGASYRKRERYY